MKLPLTRRFALLALMVLGTITLSHTQESGDSTRLSDFARFLEDSKQYEFAAEEYDKLYFLYKDSYYFDKMIRNYRLAGKQDALDIRIKNTPNITSNAIKNYTLSLMNLDDTERASTFLNSRQQQLSEEEYQKLNLDLMMVQGKYKKAEDQYNRIGISDPQYLQLIQEGKSTEKKSTVLAGVISAIVPGLGRVYAKDYSDGIISFIFVASTAYQAYRRFNKNGVKSPTAWIYSGVSLGFYIGNIYGSVQSAKYYNSIKRQEINVKSKNYINQYYSDL